MACTLCEKIHQHVIHEMEQKIEGNCGILGLSNMLGETIRTLSTAMEQGGEKRKGPRDIQGTRWYRRGGSSGARKKTLLKFFTYIVAGENGEDPKIRPCLFRAPKDFGVGAG